MQLHYPVEAVSDKPFSENKLLLLEEQVIDLVPRSTLHKSCCIKRFLCPFLLSSQRGELRCLLPKSLLDNGFFPESTSPRETKSKDSDNQGSGYSWSGHRRIPSYANKLIFPEKFLSALRTVSMKESELHQVFSLLEEVQYHSSCFQVFMFLSFIYPHDF